MQEALTTFLLALISALASAICGFFIGKVKEGKKAKIEERNRLNKIERDLMVLTRSDLIRLHDVFMQKGWCSIATKMSIEEEYEAYHDLGGNGMVTQLIEDIKNLPDQPPQYRSNRNNNTEVF